MQSLFQHDNVARGFFLFFAAIILFLYWHIIQPFVIVLATAAIVAVVVEPLEKRLRKLVKRAWLSSGLMVLFVFLLLVGPLTAVGVLMVQQAIDIVRATVANPDWVQSFQLEQMPLFQALPQFAKDYVLSVDLSLLLRNIAEWASANVATIFSGGAALVFKTFIFFICLYFFLFERERIQAEVLALSPFKDSVDKNIILRLVETVRGVVLGALIVAVLQGIVAGIGFTIFGIPGAVIWAAVVVVSSQVPILGTGSVMVPAVAYLLLTGNIMGGIGLAIWAILAVGLIDNFLSPLIVGGRTKMHALLILLSVLGGIELFGPIGFILGPTVLASVLVILELYKAGILEKKSIA